MCGPKAPPPAAPPPAPPPVLEQAAPKSKSEGSSDTKRKRQGMSQYKVPTTAKPSTNKLGGIPKKVGTG